MSSTAKTIVVVGSTGGCGASTIAINIAAGLPQYVGGRVLLVDGQYPIPSAVLGQLGVERSKALGEMVPVLGKLTPELFASYLATPAAGGQLSVLSLVSDVQQARAVTPEVLSQALALARRTFLAIVIDAGRSSHTLSPTMIESADVVCLVSEASTAGLQQGRWLLEYLRAVQIGRDAVVACLNRIPTRSPITPDIAQSMLQTRLFAAIPEDAAAFDDATLRRQPILLQQPRHVASREIDRLVREVAGRGPRVQHAASSQVIDGPVSPEKFRDAKLRVHRRLVAEIDMRKDELDYARDPVKRAELRRRAEAKVLALVEEEATDIPSRDARRQMTKEILDEALGLGALEDLLADSTISEIMVNRFDRIYVERNGKIELSGARFLSNDQLRGVIERIVAPLGRRIDEKVPMVDARLADGSRVNAIIPPLALDGPALTIRKFAKAFLTVADLVRFGSFTQQMAQVLGAAVRARQNVIVSGGTGSGKTTLLNMLSSYIPVDERIVTIEDSAELRLPQEHVVRLESRPANIEGEGAIPIRDLVKNALRMRPDRIVVGECRGGEALDMLQAMNTGHDGSLTTVHANTPVDALARIETMSLMSGLDLPARAIRDQISSAVNLIVQQARLADGSRRVTHITEVVGQEDGQFKVADIFVFKQTGMTPEGKVVGQFVPTGYVPKFVETLSRRGIALPREVFLHQTA